MDQISESILFTDLMHKLKFYIEKKKNVKPSLANSYSKIT